MATAVGVFVDSRSFFSKLPGTLTASIVNKAAGTLVAGRGLGAALGFLSGEAIARQIDYYTGLEITCLTQTSCAAS